MHFKEEDFSVENVCSNIGYSRHHADRMFKQYLKKTLQEYIHEIFLTQGANELIHTEKNVMEIAMNTHFQSHEEFTRSFYKKFQITPSSYRNQKIAIPLSIQYAISHYYILLKHKKVSDMSNHLKLCMIMAQERTRRKLIYIPSYKAKDYLSYCEEVGCDWEGLLNSIPEKLDSAALIDLPQFLTKDGISKVATGVEVPLDYDKSLPESCMIAELTECTMLYFQTEPYEKEEEFCKAIQCVYAAIKAYNPSLYGYKFAYNIAPSFNFGADIRTGARAAVPVINIKS